MRRDSTLLVGLCNSQSKKDIKTWVYSAKAKGASPPRPMQTNPCQTQVAKQIFGVKKEPKLEDLRRESGVQRYQRRKKKTEHCQNIPGTLYQRGTADTGTLPEYSRWIQSVFQVLKDSHRIPLKKWHLCAVKLWSTQPSCWSFCVRQDRVRWPCLTSSGSCEAAGWFKQQRKWAKF